MGGVLVRLVSSEGTEEVNGVSKGASSSAPMGTGEGMEDKGGLEGESGGAGMGGGACVVGRGGGGSGGGEAFRVEGVADVSDGGWVKGGYWKIIFKSEGSRMYL